MNGSANGLRTYTENLAGGPTTQSAFSQRFKNTTAVFPAGGATRLLDTSAITKWKNPMTSRIFELCPTLPGCDVPLPHQNAERCQVAGLAQAMGHKTIGQKLNAGL
jgi:hypothetical protein